VHRVSKALLREGISGRGAVGEDRHRSPWSHPNEGLGAKFGIRDLRPVESALKGSILPAPIPEAELAAIAAETSVTERRAADAERELIEWKKVKFMQDKVGEDFDAIVLNPTKYGLFIELEALFVEGLVPLDSLSAADPSRETFTYRENTRQIISAGRHGPAKRYSAGDRIHVVLERIDAVERRLQFGIYVDLETLNAAMRKPKKADAKKTDKKRHSADSAKGKTKTPDKKKGKRRKK
jgi:ribonuclease R